MCFVSKIQSISSLLFNSFCLWERLSWAFSWVLSCSLASLTTHTFCWTRSVSGNGSGSWAWKRRKKFSWRFISRIGQEDLLLPLTMMCSFQTRAWTRSTVDPFGTLKIQDCNGSDIITHFRFWFRHRDVVRIRLFPMFRKEAQLSIFFSNSCKNVSAFARLWNKTGYKCAR